MTKFEEMWPENPSPSWLGKWAAENESFLPREINLRLVREIYGRYRLSAITDRDEEDAA